MHLRCKTMLTVKLPVGEDNKVKGLPVTRGEGGILPMLMNVILSYGKAMSSSSGSSSSATTELSRGRPSGTTSTTSSGPTTGTDYAGRRLEAFQASMEEPDAATRALSAANDRPAATSPGANVSSTSTVTDRPATSCRGRHTSSASTCCCAPPADSADFPTIS